MSGTLLIAGGMLLAIAIIIFLLMASAKRQALKARQLLAAKLEQLAKEHGLVVGKRDFFRNRTIALDETKTMLLFIDETEKASHVITIRDMKACKVQRVTRRITEKSKDGKSHSEEHLDKIQLQLSLNSSAIYLTFYSDTQDGALEMQPLKEKAEQWCKAISALSFIKE